MARYRKHILSLFALLFGIGSAHQTHAIHTKEIAELYGWTAVWFLIGQYRIEQEIRQHTKPVDPAVERFIRAELHKIQLPEWQTVRIVEHPHRSMSTIDTLCLEKYLVDHITKTGDHTGMARAVIDHEGGHIKHRHIFAKAALNPFLSITSAYCAFKLVNRIYPQSNSRTVLFALDLGLYVYIISPLFNRICEWDADASIADEPRILAGGIRYFAILKQNDATFFNNLEKKAPVGGRIDRWLHECELISTHPTLEKRIKSLQQRLANHPDKYLLGYQELAYLLDPQLAIHPQHA